MNVAALLQDSPSDDRRRPQQLPPQNIQPRQQQQQQQHQPLDRERPQPHPPFHRPSSHLPYPNEYAQSHSHLLPPSPFLNDSYDPAHRTGERGGPRPLNPELLTQPQKLPPHAQQQPSRGHEAYGTLDSRSASSVPLPLRPTPPQHSQHALGPPSALYPHGAPGPPPPDYPSHISHHHERESRMSRSGAPPPAPTTLQLFPTPTLSRSRPRTPPPQAQHSSASGFPGTHSLPAPVSVSTVLSEPSPMYTGPPGPVSSPAMGSLQRPQLPSRHGPQPPSHVQGVTVTSSVTKGIHSVHTRTITPHMEGTPGHGLPPPLLEDIPLRTQAIERRRETERERERGRFSEAALANERERERREVERKDRDLRDEVLLRHHQSVTSSPERHSSGGDRMKRGLEREREREREAREKDIMIERAAARDRERDRLLHHPHHPHHHHHHIHHHHPHSNSSPHNSGLSKPPSGDFPGPPQQLDRYISASESSTSTSAPSQAAHGRPHIHHHPHSHPPPHPHLHPHQHHNHHSLPRPPGVQSHILDLSVPEPIPPPPPPHSRTFPPQPFPPPQPHHSAPPQSQSTAPLPFSFAPQLHRHTPPPLPAPPSSHLPSVPPPLTTSTVPFGIGMGHPPHKPGPSRERFGEVVNLGVYVYPRTPFPFREASEGSATSRVVESEKDKGKLKDLRAELLIPSGFLPDSDGATGLGLKGNGRKRIWGGGLAGPVYAGAYAPRIYTDDSDVFLCALHAGFLTWSGARRALREGLDLRVVVRVLKTVVSPGGGGMPGKFIGGYGAEYIGERGGTGVPSRNVRSTVRRLDEEEEEEESGEDDGRGLLSAGWGNGHDGAGIEILHAEFVPKGTAHGRTRPNRTQRLREYAEHRRAVLAPSPFSFNTSVSSDDCDPPRVKRRRVDSVTQHPVVTLQDRQNRESSGGTIVFSTGFGGNQAGFKYDPASLRSALFPYTRCPKRRRLDDEDMDVDDVDEGVAETNSDETPRRSVVVETSRESFCIYPCGGGPVESGLQEKENIDDGGTSVRGRRYSVALRVAHDDDETNDEAEKHSPCPTKKTVEAPWPALEQPSPTTCTGAPTSPDAATEAKVSSPVRVNGISETTLEPLHLKSSLLPLDAVRPPSKCSVEVLQRDLREDQLIFEDGGITVLGSKVDGDGMMRGWRIEVRTWRWGEL